VREGLLLFSELRERILLQQNISATNSDLSRFPCPQNSLENYAKLLLDFCAQKFVQQYGSYNNYCCKFLPQKSCQNAVTVAQKCVPAGCFEFCAKPPRNLCSRYLSISVPIFSCTVCSKSIQYGLHSLLYFSPRFACQNLPWNACP
jgi:hypothetical protein